MRLALALALTLVVATPAWAWTATYSWAPSAGATFYKVEKSTDSGATWLLVSSPATPTVVYTGTETALVLFRLQACNTVGCVVRAGDGLWHNEAQALPLAPGAEQVQ